MLFDDVSGRLGEGGKEGCSGLETLCECRFLSKERTQQQQDTPHDLFSRAVRVRHATHQQTPCRTTPLSLSLSVLSLDVYPLSPPR